MNDEHDSQFASALLVRTTPDMKRQIFDAASGVCSAGSWVRLAIAEKLQKSKRKREAA